MHSIRVLLCLVFISPLFQLYGQSDRRQVQGVIDDFLRAYKTLNMNLIMTTLGRNPVSIWSSGYSIEGRAAHQKAYYTNFKEMREFHSHWQTEHIQVKANMAWVVGLWQWQATMRPVQKVVKKTVRTTFILERQGPQWKIVHEHSSAIINEVMNY